MKNLRKLKGFMLVEALICLALVSIFLSYFLLFSNNIYKNDIVSLDKSNSVALAREIIEKSSSLGEFVSVNENGYEIEANKIFETKRRIDYKLSIKNKINGKVNEYEFSIDKRQKN